MARDPYTAAAEGIESGFRMGLRLDEIGEERRSRRVQETRQAATDARAEEDLQLRRKRDVRDERRLDNAERREAGTRAANMLGGRQKEIVESQRARQAGGLPVDPEMVKEYGANAEALGKIKQDALDFWSRAQTGQLDPSEASPEDLYMHVTAATGMRPEELKNMPQHINDVQAGLETGNQGLLLQGVNGLLAARLRKGVGQPSPHGGVITRKQIIGLDPARDGNGVDHPDRFIPRLRVYVQTEDGKERYYDAPATQNGSTDPDDPVATVKLGDAMDYMGQMGVLAQAAQHPLMASKLAEGAKLVGPKAQKYLDELTALSRPVKKTLARERTDLGNRTRIDTVDDTGHVIKTDYEDKGAAPRTFRPAGSGSKGVLQAKLDQLDEDLADDLKDAESKEASDEILARYKEDKRALLTGIKPGKDKTKGPSNAELNAGENKALDAVAGRMGLEYDANTKAYRNRDGSMVTTAQKDALGRAKEAITKASRDSAAGGKRTPATEMIEAGAKASGGGKAKFTEGQTATNPKTGEKMVFKGGAWQPVKK